MNTYITHAELYHYGVKGMKWGVRRAQDRLAKARVSSVENYVNASEIAKSGSKRAAGSKGAAFYTKARREHQVAEKMVEKLCRIGVPVESLTDVNTASMTAGKYYAEKSFNERLLDVATIYGAGLIGGATSYAAGRNVYTKYKYKGSNSR